MRLISCKEYILFCLICGQLCSALIHAQSQEAIHKKIADSLYNSENYFNAVTEYKRLLFFDTDSTYFYESNYQIGRCYKMGALLDEAVKYFNRAALSAESDEEKFEAMTQIIRSNILRRTTAQAFILLERLEKEFPGEKFKNPIEYWRGWAYIFNDEWDKAAAEFDKIDEKHELKMLCEQVENEKYSVTFTKVISYILPGFGQIYTGNVLSGLMSLGWNLLWGYTTITAFQENRNFDGAAIGSLLWMRFYRGNIQNAQKFAEEENIKTANKALIYLQKNYNGEKP